MAATRHLNPVQFSVEKIGSMLSLDHLGETMAQAYDSRKADNEAQHNRSYDNGQTDNTPGDAAFAARIAREGIQTPVEVRQIHGSGEQVFTHGHHRYYAARDNNMETMPVNFAGRLSNQEVGDIRYGQKK
jgi:hypothetical protein